MMEHADAPPATRAHSEPETERLPATLLERLLRGVRCRGSGEAIPVRAPATGELLGSVPRCDPEDVRAAAARARRAQPAWAATPLGERTAVLLRFHDLLLDRQDEVLELIRLESGKTRLHAFEEVGDAATVARYYARHAERHLRPKRRSGAIPGLTSTREYHHPRGVVGFISPWNYPLSMAITDALPALVAGNAAVIKPDAQAPFTALWAVDLLRSAGLPADLCQVVTGEGPEIGPPLIDSIDYLCFTGSTATGRIVAQQAAERLIGCSLELGGKNPLLVLADADLDAAVAGAVQGSFASEGQLCISLERCYVQQAVYEPFVHRLVAATLDLTLGSGDGWDVDVGSLTSERQLRQVERHVEDARAKGAAVLCGGRARPDLGPYFYEPTILEGVTPEMAVHSEETFGPVLALYRFRSLDEAVRLANASRYGLNASVWTGDEDAGREVATRLEAGTVNVNEAYAAAWSSTDAPMGGRKDSGLGRRHGREGILKYTEAQTVAVQRGLRFGPPKGLPNAAYPVLLTRALRLMRRFPGI
jgi:succinate-semialdehyde dehydrogenase/glutarate-semialdehyde dehydrogenase